MPALSRVGSAPLPSLLISGLSSCHHLLRACRPADLPTEGLARGLGTPFQSSQGARGYQVVLTCREPCQPAV